MDFWIQAIGIVAMALNITAFQFKNKRTLLLIICVGSALFSINMFLLGAITGGIMNLLGVIRSLVYVDKDKLPIPVKWVNAMFIVAYMISYVLSFTL
ncbi:MAG: YgjV family protein, partial [Clostridia bacterium]|nr:YgjV family protein [Clostridia bacterium]